MHKVNIDVRLSGRLEDEAVAERLQAELTAFLELARDAGFIVKKQDVSIVTEKP